MCNFCVPSPSVPSQFPIFARVPISLWSAPSGSFHSSRSMSPSCSHCMCSLFFSVFPTVCVPYLPSAQQGEHSGQSTDFPNMPLDRTDSGELAAWKKICWSVRFEQARHSLKSKIVQEVRLAGSTMRSACTTVSGVSGAGGRWLEKQLCSNANHSCDLCLCWRSADHTMPLVPCHASTSSTCLRPKTSR